MTLALYPFIRLVREVLLSRLNFIAFELPVSMSLHQRTLEKREDVLTRPISWSCCAAA